MATKNKAKLTIKYLNREGRELEKRMVSDQAIKLVCSAGGDYSETVHVFVCFPSRNELYSLISLSCH